MGALSFGSSGRSGLVVRPELLPDSHTAQKGPWHRSLSCKMATEGGGRSGVAGATWEFLLPLLSLGEVERVGWRTAPESTRSLGQGSGVRGQKSEARNSKLRGGLECARMNQALLISQCPDGLSLQPRPRLALFCR